MRSLTSESMWFQFVSQSLTVTQELDVTSEGWESGLRGSSWPWRWHWAGIQQNARPVKLKYSVQNSSLDKTSELNVGWIFKDDGSFNQTKDQWTEEPLWLSALAREGRGRKQVHGHDDYRKAAGSRKLRVTRQHKHVSVQRWAPALRSGLDSCLVLLL